MYFLLSIRFTCEEGDEVPVMDTLPKLEQLLTDNCNITLQPIDLEVLGHDRIPCAYEGRHRAAGH